MSNETKQPDSKAIALSPVARLKTALSSDSVQDQFRNALQDNASLFVASLIDVYGADGNLQKCAPGLVIQEALKAATLKLPINKSLGFAYIIPYKKSVKDGDKWTKVSIPQFQMGYRAFIQLAMRSGQYRCINADMVYEGEKVTRQRVTGDMSITGEAKSERVIGYFAYIEMLNGFSKSDYWPTEKVLAHAKRFSKSWIAGDSTWAKDSAWDTSFDSMALKTVLKGLLSKYGFLSVEMVSAITGDRDDEEQAREEIEANANNSDMVIDVDPEPAKEEVPAESKSTNGTAQETKQEQTAGPGW